MDKQARIGFKDYMFVYSLEEVTNPTELLVTIPDVFVDKPVSSADSAKILKGPTIIFKNTNLPALSKYYVSSNYMRLKVINYFGGTSNIVGPNIRADGNVLKISSSEPSNYPIAVGIGNVKVGDRLLATFINGNPNNGIIIARC